MHPVMLESDRVRLREVGSDDAPEAFRWASDPEFFRYMAYEVVSTVEAEAQFLREIATQARANPRTEYHLGIELKQSAELIGMIRIGVISADQRGAELGYGLRRDQWGHGLATEAGTRMLGFAFRTLKLHRVVAYRDPANVASGRVMDKLGMREEGVLLQNVWSHDGWRDSVVCAILESEWAARAGRAP